MFGRKMKTDLPLAAQESKTVDRSRVEREQEKMTLKKGRPHGLTIGDLVLAKQKKKNKLTPAFNPKPAVVTDVKGSMVTVQTGERSMTRDGSLFKKLHWENVDEQDGSGSSSAEEGVAVRPSGDASDVGEDSSDDDQEPTAVVEPEEAGSPGPSQEGQTRGAAAQEQTGRTRPVRTTRVPARFGDYEM
jgi:hypothetical protein